MKTRIKELRIELGLNQNELAEKAAISTKQLQRIENCKSNPTMNTLVNIATALEVTVNDLLYHEKVLQKSRTDINGIGSGTKEITTLT